MSIGRSIAFQTGMVGKVVLSNWKGMPTMRSLATEIVQPNSLLQLQHRKIFSEIASRWRFLTELQRAKWEANAKELGSAYDQGKHMTTRGAGNIIRRQGKLMSGFNYYVACNKIAALSGMSWPRDDAPLPTGNPPAPYNLFAKYETLPNGEVAIVCEWDDPVLVGSPSDKKVRLFMRVQYLGMKSNWQGLIVHIADIPTNTKEKRVAFTGFSCSKRWWGKEWIDFNKLNGGQVSFQADTVIADAPYLGAVRSAPSNLAIVNLPPQDNEEAKSITEFIREQNRKKVLKHRYKVKAMDILAEKLAEKLMKGEDINIKIE